jgi:hypothetical protein
MSMIMLNTRVLFEEPPLGITEVISQTIQILLTHWRPLLSLSLMQFGMAFATGLVLSVVTFIVAGSYVAGVAAIMQQGTYGGEDFGRHLFDRSVGISGASRLLQNYYFGNYNNNDNKNYYYGAEGDVYQMDDLFLNGLNLSATFIVILLLITVVWVVFLALVASIFAGSYSHALAEIYAGGIPCAKRSFGKGVERMWAVYCYQIFLSLVIIGAAVIFVVLPVYLEVSYPSAARMLITILSVFVYIMFAAMLSALMTAAIPSIVVENKSSMEGFQRSIHLCKNFIWFVFCSQFCFEIGLVLTLVLINQVLEHLPSFLGWLVISL